MKKKLTQKEVAELRAKKNRKELKEELSKHMTIVGFHNFFRYANETDLDIKTREEEVKYAKQRIEEIEKRL